MIAKGYRNARLTAIRHLPDEEKLVLGFEGLPDCEFSGVADFSLNGFFQHNILFDIYEYDLTNCRITSTAAKTGRFSTSPRRQARAASSSAPHFKAA